MSDIICRLNFGWRYAKENLFMKKIKICALALGTCIALGALAGCGSTEGTTASSAASETTAASSSEAASSEASDSEATADTSASEEAQPDPETSEDETVSGGAEIIELDADGQKYANTFVSNFAEVTLYPLVSQDMTTEELLDFVHIHLKINANDNISYETKGDVTYETFTWEKAQSVVGKYFNVYMEYGYEDLLAPPGTYGDQAAGPYYEDGKIWYEAADGEMHTSIAIVDSVENPTGDGTLTLKFTIYEIDYETFSNLDMDGIRAYYKLTPAEAAADSTLSVVTTGTAIVDVGQSGDYYLRSYETALYPA